MNYYNDIKQELISNEINKQIKYYSKNKYGENIIGQYSDKLMIEVGKKYDKSTLFKIRKFYLMASNEKVAPLVPQLSWSHCLILLPIKNINKINYYISQISKRNLSKRQLQDIIRKQEYERLPKDTKNKLYRNILSFVKNPIRIKNNIKLK